MVARTPGQPNDAIGVFIKPTFGIPYAETKEQQGKWGTNNPPLYVSQVYYGRMIVATVDQNEYTIGFYDQL